MSYSFNVTATTKKEASAKVADELKKVCETQPDHVKDCDQAHAAAVAFIELLPAPAEGEQFSIWVNGSLSWKGDGNAKVYSSASVGVGVSVVPVPKPTEA